MDALEWVRQDMDGGAFKRNRTGRSHYYTVLRDLLKDEIGGRESCGLLEQWKTYLQPGNSRYMYLLDAAALWECHEVLLEGIYSFRDAKEARFPDIVQVGAYSGERLRWSDVEDGRMPVAVVDEQLRIRLQELADYAALPVYKREDLTRHSSTRVRHPQLVGRAKLLTATLESVQQELPAHQPVQTEQRCRVCGADIATVPARLGRKRCPMCGTLCENANAPVRSTRDAVPADLPPQPSAREAELVRQLAECGAQITTLQRENADMQEQLRRAAPPQGNTDGTLAVAELILQGRLNEATEKAAHLGGQLHESLRRLEEQEAALVTLQEQLSDVVTKLEADRLRVEALRGKQRAAEAERGDIRRQCDEAQRDAALARAETESTRNELREARESLMRTNEELRELQRQKAAVSAAEALMRLQIGKY